MNSIFDSPQFNANLFFPRPDRLVPPEGTDEIYIEVDPGVKVHLRRYLNPDARFSLLYFHGNGEIASDYDELSKAFAYLKAEFVACDYRGYGRSGGQPTLRSALKDAHTIYQTLKSEEKLKNPLCVMGRSLGSAPAIELCSQYPEIDCCVIESGYADPIPLVERRGLRIDKTTPEEDALFNNSQKIKKVTCPLLIMHGGDDMLIVPQEAELNYQQAGSRDKALQILEGVGHNDILMAPDNGYFNCLSRFFDKVLESK
ncbi:MAG: alpha/beta hydrolase [candidate division Zixibacteria bacterium]|nr:alpha/beta hydrolase [candidate division KSB1 bacterium]NIR63956.1 alpha/beta hydrolase [candidate division Zixibacteria bacterium]NIT51778.1 alpha/beta hydrolase [candidate division Zixibacteria bacterium]NIV06046.1 alpha/beta hydrolase [candidate division Zixibacteria bacterium]NIX56011.1 alpha/beta hydrolase [candidate division Zixibacteria bacterium]